MTASQKPKTPSMVMDVVPGISEKDVQTFCKRASKLALSQVVDSVTVKERLTVKHQVRHTEFQVDIQFFPAEEYLAEYEVESIEILSVFGTRFPLILKREIQLEMKKLDADLRHQIDQLGKGKASKEPVAGEAEEGGAEGEGPTSGGADDESERGDGDIEDAKVALRKKEQSSYESDEESDAFDDDAIEAAYASDNEGSDMDGEHGSKRRLGRPTTLRDQTEIVADAFERNFHQASSFEFRDSCCSFKLEVCCRLPHWIVR